MLNLKTDLEHKTAFIQLLSHWFQRQFVGSDSNEHDAVLPESGCFVGVGKNIDTAIYRNTLPPNTISIFQLLISIYR